MVPWNRGELLPHGPLDSSHAAVVSENSQLKQKLEETIEHAQAKLDRATAACDQRLGEQHPEPCMGRRTPSSACHGREY